MNLQRRNWSIELCVRSGTATRYSLSVHARRRGLSPDSIAAYLKAISQLKHRGTVTSWLDDGIEWQLAWNDVDMAEYDSIDTLFGLMLTHLDSLVYAVSTGRTMDDGYNDIDAALDEHHRLMKRLDAGESVEDVYGY